jgi:beta-glucosidase
MELINLYRVTLTGLLVCTLSAYGQQGSNGVEQRVDGILSQMTLEEKLSYISGVGFPTSPGVFNIKPIPHLGLPEIFGSDGTLGIVGQGTPPGTRYPAGPVLASTWNPDRAFEEGLAQGREGRARGLHEILGPGVDFYRTSLGGRSFEYMTGEDPLIGAVLLAAEVNGMQSQQVMATTKHYACNDQEIDRLAINVVVDERTLREIYLPPYEGGIKLGHSAAVMGAFNKVNGDFACESLFLDTNVLKQDWGFQGFIESDFTAIHDGLKAALAGMDLDMPGGTLAQMTSANLLPAIQSGQLSVNNIDDKVRRILREIISFGFLDRPQLDSSIPINDPQSKATAVDVAREGIVLLKNEPQILPLNKNTITRIGVIGINTQGEPPGGGGSAEVPASTSFTSEFGGIQALAGNGVSVEYISACVPDPASAVWATGQDSSGLVGQYFNSADLSGSPVATRVDTELNIASFDATNVPVLNPSSFSAIWTGTVQPTISGDQVFKVASGGFVRLYVNNQLIIDNFSNTSTPSVPVVGKIALQAGVAYSLRLEFRIIPDTFFGPGGLSGLRVSWASLQPPATLAGYNAVILAVGANEDYESEGHDRSFSLPEFQDELIQNAAKINPAIIVVLHGGGGFDVQAWVDRVPALLHVWFPGQYGGQALGEILFGAVTPSGKLPITMEKHAQDNPAFASFPTDPNAAVINYNTSYNSVGNSEGLFIGYRGYEKNQIQPQYPFGYGLSYTTFSYSDLDIDPVLLKKEDHNEHGLTKADWKEHQGDNDGLIRVSFRVTNTGKRAGAEIAQLYAAPVNPPVTRPLKELKGFKKVFLQPGESKKVTITLDRRSLAYYDVSAHAWDVARGVYRILVGSSSQDTRLNGVVVNLFSSSLSVRNSTPVPAQDAD